MPIITGVVNPKGGGTKSAACVNLASTGAQKGKRVLLCDFDQQGTSTSNSGMQGNPDINLNNYSTARLFFEDVPVSDLILETPFGYDIIPATGKVYEADAKIQSTPAGEMALLYAFMNDSENLSKYDLIICDTQGAVTKVLTAVLLMLDDFFISNTADKEAIEQLDTMLGVVDLVNKSRRSIPNVSPISLRGHFFNAADPREVTFRIFDGEMSEKFGDRHLSDFFINKASAHRQASLSAMPLVNYQPKARATLDYFKLFDSLFPELAGE